MRPSRGIPESLQASRRQGEAALVRDCKNFPVGPYSRVASLVDFLNQHAGETGRQFVIRPLKRGEQPGRGANYFQRRAWYQGVGEGGPVTGKVLSRLPGSISCGSNRRWEAMQIRYVKERTCEKATGMTTLLVTFLRDKLAEQRCFLLNLDFEPGTDPEGAGLPSSYNWELMVDWATKLGWYDPCLVVNGGSPVADRE